MRALDGGHETAEVSDKTGFYENVSLEIFVVGGEMICGWDFGGKKMSGFYAFVSIYWVYFITVHKTLCALHFML